MAGRKKKPLMSLLVVDGDRVEGEHTMKFDSVYSCSVRVSFSRDQEGNRRAHVIVQMDDGTLESAELETDFHAMDQFDQTLEAFLGFPVTWVEQAFMEYRSSRRDDALMTRSALSGPLDVRFKEQP